MARLDFHIQDFIDRQPVRPLHIAVLFLCSFVLFLDAFDFSLLGKVAPAVAAEFGHPVEDMTTIFVFQQVGRAIGAFAIVPLGVAVIVLLLRISAGAEAAREMPSHA